VRLTPAPLSFRGSMLSQTLLKHRHQRLLRTRNLVKPKWSQQSEAVKDKCDDTIDEKKIKQLTLTNKWPGTPPREYCWTTLNSEGKYIYNRAVIKFWVTCSLVLCGWILSTTGNFTYSIKGKSSRLGLNDSLVQYTK